jgi:Na+/proline symporter
MLLTVCVNSRTATPLEEPFVLFRITFMYYTILGFIIVIVVGIIVSLFTEPQNLEDMNPTLFSPVVRKYVLGKTQKCEMKVIDGKKVLYVLPSE